MENQNRAVIVDPAQPGKLILGDVDAPVAKENEAVIGVKAISLNRGEVNMTRKPRPNWRPGWDLAGIVETAAPNGSGPKVGERVVGIVPSGAWAEKVAVGTDALAVLPESVTFAQAATLPVAGLTALHALAKGGLLIEKTVLITGATGGVGDFAVQIAKISGAFVVAQVRREEDAGYLRELGADAVVVGESVGDAKQYAPLSLILDSVGGQVLGDALGLVDEGTILVSFGVSAGATVTFDAQKFFGAGMTKYLGMFLFDDLKTVESGSVGLARLLRLIEKKKLTPRIGLEASWSEVDSVAQKLLDRQFKGKAVLHVGD